MPVARRVAVKPRSAPRAEVLRAVATGLPVLAEGYAYDEARPLAESLLAAGLSVLVRGHPGVGKSTLAREIAAAMGLPLVDIRLAQRDPAEIGGVYFPDRERRVLDLLPPDWVQTACAAPAFVFLDEINAAVTKLHQAAAYQIVLERRVGPFAFHPGTVVMAAGNLEEDHAIVSPMSSALSNRFAHLSLRADADAWVRWANKAKLHEAVVAFIAREGESALYEAPGDGPFPTPRSWEMTSRALATARPEDRRRVVAACVGTRAAERFFAFLMLYERVDPRGIVERGDAMDFTAEGSTDPSFAQACVHTVSSWVARGDELDDAFLPNVVRFLRSPGLDVEFAFLFLRRLKGRGNLLVRLRALPEFRELAAAICAVHVGLEGGGVA